MDRIIAVMKKEFFRFFHDKRMLFSSVLLPGVMIYVMYSIIGQAGASQRNVEDDYQTVAYGINVPASLQPAFESMNIQFETDITDIVEMKQKVEDKEVDLILAFSQDFDAQVAVYDSMTATQPAPQVEVFYNSSRTESSKAYAAVTSVLSQYESSMINKFDVNGNTDNKYDLASDKDSTAQLFSMLFPMLLLTFVFSGCMALAPEAIAGEKERGTITTILVTPIRQTELAIGKIVSLSVMSILSAISSFIATVLSLPKLIQGDGVDNISANVYSVTDYLVIFFVLISSVIVIISVISIISAYAKSVKEAGTLVTPLMIIVMLIGLTAMFDGAAKSEIYWYFIPLFNSVQSMLQVFSFDIHIVPVIVTIVSNIVYGGIFAVVLAKMFQSERIMYSK